VNASRVVDGFQQLGDTFSADWINEVRRDLGKRLKNESAIAKLRMGDRQASCF